MDPRSGADTDTNTVPIRKSQPNSPPPARPGSPSAGNGATPAAADSSRRSGSSAKVHAAAPARHKTIAEALVPCPRCGAALTNPGPLGWCQKCGYCQSLEDEAPITARMTQRKPVSTLGTLEILEMIRETPRWLRVLLGGVVVIALLSLVPNHFLDEDCLERAIYTTVQIGVGLLMCIVAHFWAGVWIGVATDHEIGPKDFILPFQLWATAFNCLPRSRKPVTLGAWGVAVMLCAVLLVGGLDFWWEVYDPKKFAPPPSRDMASPAVEDGQQDKGWDQKLKDPAKYGEKNKEEEKKKSKIDRRPAVPCVIIGYLVDNDRLTGLVLARASAGRLVYAGVVRTGFEKAAGSLLKELAPLRQEQPYIPGLEITAIWVNPEVVCAVHQSGTDAAGLLANPNFKELMKRN